MAQVILYKTERGNLAIITPAPMSALTPMQVALKDVPIGSPFLIVEDTDLPQDREYIDAWEADFSQPHGYGVGSIDLAPDGGSDVTG